MQRILAIWLPNWPIQRLIHDKPELERRAVILQHRTRRGLCVLACSRLARQQGVHVVVGTPGRMMDHMNRRTLTLDSLQCVILDEADEMLRMGFIDDVKWILDQTPSGREPPCPRLPSIARGRQYGNRIPGSR